MPAEEPGHDRWRCYWDKHYAGYDQMGFSGGHLFGDSRQWVCSRATGQTLEVAIGTGLNLPFYGENVQLTGIDFRPAMLAVARNRASSSDTRSTCARLTPWRYPSPTPASTPQSAPPRCAPSPTTGGPSPR